MVLDASLHCAKGIVGAKRSGCTFIQPGGGENDGNGGVETLNLS